MGLWGVSNKHDSLWGEVEEDIYVTAKVQLDNDDNIITTRWPKANAITIKVRNTHNLQITYTYQSIFFNNNIMRKMNKQYHVHIWFGWKNNGRNNKENDHNITYVFMTNKSVIVELRLQGSEDRPRDGQDPILVHAAFGLKRVWHALTCLVVNVKLSKSTR